MQYKDYYQILGVPKAATADELRKAFRKLARQFHPDVAKDKKAAEEKFKEINEAYEVLGDPEKRKRYDELGSNWQGGAFQPPPRGRARGPVPGGADPFGDVTFGGTGFSDFFEQFFSGRRGRAGGPAGFQDFGEAERGGDVEADLLVTIDEALNGAKKTISLRREGSPKVETYEVRIPRGIREGQRIRLAGQGESGGRGKAGDLFLRVRLERHPDYRVEGDDLVHELELPAWQAVLGGEIEVPTPDGAVRLKIPAGAQPGRKFRIKGRGFATAGGGRGDFYVQLAIAIPESLTAEERAAWEALAQLPKS